jgi:UPF0755 protein
MSAPTPAQPRRDTRHPRRRAEREHPRRLSLAITLLVFLVVVGGVAWAASYYRGCREAPEGPRRAVEFVVPEGATGQDVVAALAEQGLIRCGGTVGSLLLRGTGKADAIIAGTYTLRIGMPLDRVMEILTTPPKAVSTVTLTVPEGYRLTEVARRVQEDTGIKAAVFEEVATDGSWSLPPYLPERTATTEGFLFPKSYEFVERGLKPKTIVARMLEQFGDEVQGLPWKHAEDLGVDPYEVVVIASMIEEEARIQKDRPLISAVIYNRLAKGMTLGIDATVGYIDPDPSDGVTDADFAIDSPYNTRLNPGLPPTPITNPGLPAIRAALTPAEVDYLYYVACGNDGGHRFSVSYDAFLANKAECLG